jgi:sensor c-di-GMP phosphodiesterase-like protein
MNTKQASTTSPQRPAADHWRRFRRLMAFMTLAAVGTAAFAIWQMKQANVPMPTHFIIAMGGGIVIALLLAGALMGLAFVSNRSGHDEEVSPPE